jgi:hypothetical protein
MQSRRSVSIFLAFIFIACAIALIVFTTINVINDIKVANDMMINYQGSASSSENALLNATLWNNMYYGLQAAAGLLAVMCIILAAVLLTRAGRKVKPVSLAIWGSGVTFFALLTAAFCLQNVIIFSIVLQGVDTTAQKPPEFVGLAIAAAAAFIAGAVVCFFASALYRAIGSGTLKELAVRAAPVYAAVTPQPQAVSPTEALQKLAALKEAGLITPEEFDSKRAEIIQRM